MTDADRLAALSARRRVKPGGPGRILTAGLVAGGGLGLIGAMAAAADQASPAPPLVHQVVVPTNPDDGQRIVVVLPSEAGSTTVTAPPPPIPAPSVAAPVTESGGS